MPEQRGDRMQSVRADDEVEEAAVSARGERQALPDEIEQSVLRMAVFRPLDRAPVCLRERALPATELPPSLRAIAYLTGH